MHGPVSKFRTRTIGVLPMRSSTGQLIGDMVTFPDHQTVTDFGGRMAGAGKVHAGRSAVERQQGKPNAVAAKAGGRCQNGPGK